MEMLLLVGGGEDCWEQVASLAASSALEPLRVEAPAAVLSLLELGSVAVVIVDGRPAAGWQGWSLSDFFHECSSRGVPLLYLGALAEVPEVVWESAPGLFDLLSPPLEAPLLRARVAHLQLLQRLHRALDRKSLEIEVLQQELDELSSLDHETGLFGRRYFVNHLAKEWRQAERSGGQLVLLRLAIDNFPDYCQRWGREAGSSRLCAVAEALYPSLLRPSDLLARMDEVGFAILLPETESSGVEEVVKRLRRAVAELAGYGADDSVTVSVGSAQRLPAATKKEWPSWEDFLQAADKALEQARSEGGDRVVSSPPFLLRGGEGESA